MPAKGDPQVADALCIITSPVAGLCCQVKTRQSAQPEKPEVQKTSEPSSCRVWVLAAVADCDWSREATVDDILSSFPPPTEFSSSEIVPEPSDQDSAAMLQVSGDLTKMITAFARIGCT